MAESPNAHTQVAESADTPLARIRAAERLVRERAEAASRWTPDAWFAVNGAVYGGTAAPHQTVLPVTTYDGDAEHIATWHPLAALAVADMLKQAAMDVWAHGPLCECGTGCDACDDNLWEPHARAALALADVVLPPGTTGGRPVSGTACADCSHDIDRELPDPVPEGYEFMWSEALAGRALYCQSCYDAFPPATEVGQ